MRRSRPVKPVRSFFKNPGDRYFRLSVVKPAEPDEQGRNQYVFQCDCGSFITTIWGKEKSCGCSWWNQHSYKERLKSNVDNKTYWINRLYCSYRRAAQVHGREFDLTKLQFENIIEQTCFYCGERPKPPQTRHESVKIKFVCNGLDRVDTTGGYTLSNVVACCFICNRAKSTLSTEDFLAWIEKVHAYQMAKRG